MIDVRRIRPTEGPLLRHLRLQALADSPWAFGSTLAREEAFPASEWTRRATEAAAGCRQVIHLATRHTDTDTDGGTGTGDVLGLVGGMRPSGGDVVELVSLWVSPIGRKRGAGRCLVDAVVAWAEAGGAGRVELWVTTGNDTAVRLYRTCGFVEVDDVQPHPDDPCRNEARMARELPGPPLAQARSMTGGTGAAPTSPGRTTGP